MMDEWNFESFVYCIKQNYNSIQNFMFLDQWEADMYLLLNTMSQFYNCHGNVQLYMQFFFSFFSLTKYTVHNNVGIFSPK